ncbi:MAG: hypothetical protein FWG68_04215 [Defluviitaleaceae bacterium]|nr:hypothetical protein [Defluviitaleaceae bacterium]
MIEFLAIAFVALLMIFRLFPGILNKAMYSGKNAAVQDMFANKLKIDTNFSIDDITQKFFAKFPAQDKAWFNKKWICDKIIAENGHFLFFVIGVDDIRQYIESTSRMGGKSSSYAIGVQELTLAALKLNETENGRTSAEFAFVDRITTNNYESHVKEMQELLATVKDTFRADSTCKITEGESFFEGPVFADDFR